MAEIVLTAIINKSVEIGGNVLFQQGRRLYWLKEDIDWLQREMRYIRSYVHDAKAKAEVEGDSRLKTFMKDIQELGEDVENLLDEFLPKIESHKSKIGRLKTACIACRSSFADEFASEIEKIKRRVAEIDRVRSTYNIMDTSNNNNNQYDYVPLDRRRLFLYADETEVVGLDDDFNMLEAKLLDQDLPYGVVSIVGMPGLGKTTLAKKLYRHVRGQFECSALVYVSQQPSVGQIFPDIAKQVGLSEEKMKDHLLDNLRSHLKRKRYVILMDDIWNVKDWDDLKIVFPECDSKAGSRIIITSRNNRVGRYIGEESSLHFLQPLDLEKSFELFSKRMFTLDNNYWANAPPNLEKIGKEIVRRCGGVPLAIVLAAGMLRARERTEHEWNGVLGSMGQDSENECGKILTLSYNDLPTTLRPCFLYFGLFPEDYEIRVFDLTNMWIAEKFIVVSDGIRREIEDIAEDFLNDLVSRNLIQVSRRTFRGRISRCRIHDLLHDLCITLARESNFFLTEDNTSRDLGVVARRKRLAFYFGGSDKFFSSHPNPKNLCALLHFSDNYESFRTHLQFKFLSVLFVHITKKKIVDGICDGRIPEGIGNLSCLVYLKFRGYNFVGNIPHSIVKLKHLMTIDIEKTGLSITIEVMQMKQLRHLRLSQVILETFMKKSGFSSSINYALLPNLQTLVRADGGYMKARWFHQWTNLRKLGLHAQPSFIKEVFSTSVAMLPKLEVLKLWIDLQDFHEINLSSYDNLLKLSLTGRNLESVNFRALPSNLVKLTLRGWLNTNPIIMIKKLPKLKILILSNFTFGEHQIEIYLSGANSFPQLEELHIVRLPSGLIREIITDELGASKLNKIILPQNSRNLLMLSERLQRLTIYK